MGDTIKVTTFCQMNAFIWKYFWRWIYSCPFCAQRWCRHHDKRWYSLSHFTWFHYTLINCCCCYNSSLLLWLQLSSLAQLSSLRSPLSSAELSLSNSSFAEFPTIAVVASIIALSLVRPSARYWPSSLRRYSNSALRLTTTSFKVFFAVCFRPTSFHSSP